MIPPSLIQSSLGAPPQTLEKSGEPGGEPSGVLIIGAGQAGVQTAEALRSGGYAGPLTVLGEEPHPPYRRPPLSKIGRAHV